MPKHEVHKNVFMGDKMFKKIAIGFAALVLVIGLGAYFLMSNLDHIIKNAVEKYASAATQSSVSLDSVKLTLSSGDGQLSGLSIANPKGFSTPKAFYLGSVKVNVDTPSIRGTGPIIIHEVIIDQPQVTYELLNSGDSNLQTIQKNTQAYASSFQKGSSTNDQQASVAGAEDAQKPSRKIVINNLIIRNGHVAIAQELLQGRQLGTSLPEIHLTDIGKNSGGATVAQVTQQVLSAIISSASQASITELAKEKISGVLKAVPASAIGAGAVDAVGTHLKGVFGQ